MLASADPTVQLRSYPENLEHTSCPVCGAADLSPLYEGPALRESDVIVLHICLRCTHMFINPRPSMATLVEFYQQARDFELAADAVSVTLDGETAHFHQAEFWSDRVGSGMALYDQHFKGRVTADDLVFDFGCGDGGWLWGVQLVSGCSVDGVEIDGYYSELVEGYIGRPIFRAPVEEAAADIVARYRGRAAAAIVSSSLQHMLDPLKCLRTAREILADDGLLYVCNWSVLDHFMAQYGGAARRLLGENLSWNYLHYFHETSFRYLLAAAGFEIVDFSLHSGIRPGHMDALARKGAPRPALPSSAEVTRIVMRVSALQSATYVERLRLGGLSR